MAKRRPVLCNAAHSFLVLLLVFMTGSVEARCLTTISTSDSVQTKMDEALSNGCSVYFEPGIHTTTSRLGYTFAGTAEDPVVIFGDSASTTKLFRPDANQNLMDLGGEYFIVRDMELEGGSKGLRLSGSASHARFTNLVIHDTADSAFSANDTGGTYTNLSIAHSEFYNTAGLGECMYLGCNNNSCTLGDSVVEFNYCHHTTSTQGSDQGDGIELKGGAYNVIIRHNVIRDTVGPGILTYANAGGGQNVIEGNVILNSGNVGIQFTGDTVVRNNVVYMNHANNPVGINGSASNQGLPDNVQIQNNTVINTLGDGSNDCLAVRGWNTGATKMVIANNALYCGGGRALYVGSSTSQDILISNNAVEGLVVGTSSGTFSGGVAADQFEGIANVNLFPRSTSVLLDAGAISQAPSLDFNCIIRDSDNADVGAYQFSFGGNTGWTESQTFKACHPLVFTNGFEL